MAVETALQIDDSSVVATLACATAQYHTNQDLGHIQFIPEGQSIHFDRRIYLQDPDSCRFLGGLLGLNNPAIANYRWAHRQFPTHSEPIEPVMAALRNHIVHFDEFGGQGYHALAFPTLGFFNNGVYYQGHPNYVIFDPNKGYIPVFGVKLPKHQVSILGAYYSFLLKNLGFDSDTAISFHHNPVLGWRAKEHTYGHHSDAMANVLVDSLKIARDPNHYPAPVMKPNVCAQCVFNGISCFTGAPDEHNLTLISSIGGDLQELLFSIGIYSIDDLATADVENIKLSLGDKIKGLRRGRLRDLQELAIAYQRQETILKRPIEVPNTRFEIHFDDETNFDYDNEGNPFPRIFHNGAYFVDNNTGERTYIYTIAKHYGLTTIDEHFTEYMDEAERDALRAFWNDLSQRTGGFKNTTIFHYGPHDRWTTLNAVNRLLTPKEVDKHPFVSGRPHIIDALNELIRKSVVSPWGRSLKTLTTRHFDYNWRVTVLGKEYNATSFFATRMYKLLLASQGASITEAYEAGMVEYNRKDCIGLYDLVHNLASAKGVRIAY